MKEPKIAIIHEHLDQYGGAERVLEALHEIWPRAPVYTTVYDQEKMRSFGFDNRGWDIRTSFMQNLPLRDKLPKYYFTIFYPLAFNSFDLQEYDVIISDPSYAAKNIRKNKDAIHISYCHTPPRFLWGFDQETSISSMKPWEKWASQAIIPILKQWDLSSAKKVDYFIANSLVVQDRIKNIYHRESEVIYPPVDLERFQKTAVGPADLIKQPYFLVISRLGEYKKIDLVVEAFNELGFNLKIIGAGPRVEYLQSIAKPNIEFLGRLKDEIATFYLQNCFAFIFPTDEDFGITPVEALSCGKPVIAFQKGGVLESLTKETALFFYPQTAEALKEAVKNFDQTVYNPITLKKQAEKFSKQRFQKEIKQFLTGHLKEDLIKNADK